MIARWRNTRLWPPSMVLEARIKVADWLLTACRRLLPYEMERELFNDWEPLGSQPREVKLPTGAWHIPVPEQRPDDLDPRDCGLPPV